MDALRAMGDIGIVCLSLRQSFAYRNARDIGLAPPESDITTDTRVVIGLDAKEHDD